MVYYAKSERTDPTEGCELHRIREGKTQLRLDVISRTESRDMQMIKSIHQHKFIAI